MVTFEEAKSLMKGRLLSDGIITTPIPFRKVDLIKGEKYGDALVFVPSVSLGCLLKQYRQHFVGNTFSHQNASFMRTIPDTGWWLLSIDQFVEADVITIPHRAPAVVFAYTCIKYRELYGNNFFKGVVTTNCFFEGSLTLPPNPLRAVVVESHDSGISVRYALESTLPSNRRTAYGKRHFIR